MSAPAPPEAVYETTTAAETEALGARLAAELTAGDVVLLTGDLGSGKTTFTRGALRALGVEGSVTSPTFTIGRRYDGARIPASHLDLHRLSTLADEDPGLLDDYVGDGRVAFVEWPEIADGELPGRVVARVKLEHGGADRRRITVERVA
jgi:tRNA threonylcarbamoyladenosine biosynthesis protein TsaE